MIGRFSVASSSSSLQDHVEEHDRKATAHCQNAETAKKQLFRQTMLKPNVEAWVWAFVDNSFAYRLADSESFRAALQHAAAFPGGKAIKNGVPVLADELRREFREKYQSQPALLACDGESPDAAQLRAQSGPLIYVCSRRVRDTTAATIAANIAAVRGLAVTSLGVIPVGCVTDNASAMVAALSGCELEATDDEEAEDEKEETDKKSETNERERCTHRKDGEGETMAQRCQRRRRRLRCCCPPMNHHRCRKTKRCLRLARRRLHGRATHGSDAAHIDDGNLRASDGIKHERLADAILEIF
jgi:hypothetical protein